MLKNKGFTLIELLVVIAIIGILATVIMAGLKSAREKGADNAIKAELKEIPAQSEIYASNNNYSFVNMCSQGVTDSIYPILVSVAKKAHLADSDVNAASIGSAGSWVLVTCNAGRTKWAIDVPMINTDDAGNPLMYCIDSSGFAGTRLQPMLQVNNGNYKCPSS